MKVLKKIFMKLVKKSVKDAVSNSEVVPVPGAEPADDSRKAFWKFVIQTLISILTAILTALGATSCMGLTH